jgi:hypothetical protein
VVDQRLGDLEASGQHRVEARHRFLKDHSNFVAAHILHRLFGQRQQITARELDAALNAAALWRNEPHDGESAHALARARLPDDRDRLLRGNVERHVPDDGNPLPIANERGGQIRDREHRRPRFSERTRDQRRLRAGSELVKSAWANTHPEAFKARFQ